MNADLNAVQLDLEKEALGLGIERYRKEVQRNAGGTPPGRILVRKATELLTPAIEAFVKEGLEGKAGRNAGIVYYLQQFDADMLALLTSTACIQIIAGFGGTSLQADAARLAGLLEDQVNHEALKAQDPKVYSRLLHKLAKSGNDQRYRHVVLHRYQQHARVVAVKWELSERVRLGTTLIHLFVEATGMGEIETSTTAVGSGKVSMRQTLTASEETQAWLEQAHRHAELLAPIFMPMVVEPLPWTTPTNGGYLMKELRVPLVKTRNANYLRELENADLGHIYKAVNALQSTPWRVNTGVLTVMEELWEVGAQRGGLPPRENIPTPVMTHNPETDEEAHKAWKRKAAEIHERNSRLRSKRVSVARKLGIAKRMTGFDRFYFAYNLDWRGRIYTLASEMSPQADDAGKALLQFAEGVKLGEGGAFWLAVHLANNYGVDKVTFDQRVEWVQAHQQEIVASAIDPQAHGFWLDADNPFQFLAAAKEWAGLVMWTQAGNATEDFESHLPVGLDGSCNGLQNFSMALRDEVGGAATNLIPSEKPADIYQRVADVASEIVEADIVAGVEEARNWKGKVNRKMAKRPTMTMPYGSGRFGFKDQIMQTLKEIENETGEEYVVGDRFRNALYLAGVLSQAIGRVVVKASEAMDWLQAVAGLAAQDELPVSWVAPSGLPVLQAYKETIGKRLDFIISGQRYRLQLSVEGAKLDKRKQRSGIAPNYVHSLDAAHLVRSVNYCLDTGIASFAMVHDSFGTHAGNVDALAYELRRAFVDQYSADVLGKFREEIDGQLTTQRLKDKLPPVPSFGTLDTQAVMDSEYFFA